MLMMMMTNFIYFVHFIILKTNVSLKLITMNKTLISTLAHTLSLESISENGTRVPKHVGVCVCFMYIVSRSAFVAKYSDCRKVHGMSDIKVLKFLLPLNRRHALSAQLTENATFSHSVRCTYW